MASVSRSRFFRGFLAFLLIGAGLIVGWLGVSLLMGAVTERGSPAGNILSAALGLSLLGLSSVFFYRWDYQLEKIITPYYKRRGHVNAYAADVHFIRRHRIEWSHQTSRPTFPVLSVGR